MRKHSLALRALLSLCVLCLSLAAFAQQQTKVHRVGMLLVGSPASFSELDIIRKQFRDFGYIEGRDLVIDLRWAEGKPERLPTLAGELVALKPDVIVAFQSDGALAAKQATTTIPIVMVLVADPVGSGLVASLAHPGGNVTGVYSYAIDLIAKDVELIHAVAPKAARIGILMSDNAIHPRQVKGIEAAAKNIGLAVAPAMDRSNDELEQAFTSWAREGVAAVIILAGSRQAMQRARIAELATKYRMATLCSNRAYAEKGCLMSYGANLAAEYRLAVTYVDKILKGAKPADLPVEQPPTFELVINLKTAKALGLTIPQSLLLRADEVIR